MPRYGRIDPEYASHLATCALEQDGPIFMVNFMKYRARAEYDDGRDDGITGKEADDRYAPLDILADIGALVVFFGDVEAGGDWDRVGIVRYPTRRSFMMMQARPDFQSRHAHKVAGMERTIVCGTLPTGVRSPASTGSRVLFELAVPGAPLAHAGAGHLRVEGTILGDGRRFATLGVSWVGEAVVVPAASAERAVAIVRPTIDRFATELGMTAPASGGTWS